MSPEGFLEPVWQKSHVLCVIKTSSPEPPNLNWWRLVESLKSGVVLGKSQRRKEMPGGLQIVAAQRKKKVF